MYTGRKKAARKSRDKEKTTLNVPADREPDKTEDETVPDGHDEEEGRDRISPFILGLLSLVIKLLVVSSFAFILLSYVFGLTRNVSLNMQPSMRDGDLVFYYRIIEYYASGDAVVVRYRDRDVISRIVAVAGDTVDITEDGLIVNGSLVQEAEVLGPTTQFEGGVTFPLTVPAGEVFLLGDNRPHATDSRIFGCVNVADISGRVVGVFRRRNL